MNKTVSVVLILGGVFVVSSILVRAILIDLSVMHLLESGGKLQVNLDYMPSGYTWAVFALGVGMVFLGTLFAWPSRRVDPTIKG